MKEDKEKSLQRMREREGGINVGREGGVRKRERDRQRDIRASKSQENQKREGGLREVRGDYRGQIV